MVSEQTTAHSNNKTFETREKNPPFETKITKTVSTFWKY
jgi:hypothetical protein